MSIPENISKMNADEVIAFLGLEPHPEGGHFKETWRADTQAGERACGTAIYFLLKGDEYSHWHRVDASEIWHFYAGSPLVISLSPNGHDVEAHHLGPQLQRGQKPQIIVPPNCWQTATSLGAWTLVGCTVSPGFEFSGFELAEPNWRPVPRGS